MHDPMSLVSKSQDHIMILTSVIFGTEKLHAIKEFPLKAAEMTDIIVGSEIIYRKIRLEMKRDHFVDIIILKCGLITVDIVRTLFIDDFNIFIQYARMQYIIMIEKCYVIACSKLKALIGILGYALIGSKLLIPDPVVLFCKRQYIFSFFCFKIV